MSRNVSEDRSELAGRLARIALGCLHREYPNHISHLLTSDADVGPPRRLTPAFYGCFDWHSAVHGHWCLVRLLRCFPGLWSETARTALRRSFTPENMDGELAYLSAPGREGFERPYGLAWLLQLGCELREWDDAEAQQSSSLLRPLEVLARERFARWLPRLSHPIRSGEHSQTAFALGLALDWSRTCGDAEFESLLVSRSRDFYEPDRGWPFRFEPSGHDFLSAGLAEADLMRRVLSRAEFAEWFEGFCPEFSRGETVLRPVVSPDPSDGKLAHLDGLNLSRAWMAEGISQGLPPDDARISVLHMIAAHHREAGFAAITGEHYAGAHWLASFATYLLTGRGQRADVA
jgi:hypothetical protein